VVLELNQVLGEDGSEICRHVLACLLVVNDLLNDARVPHAVLHEHCVALSAFEEVPCARWLQDVYVLLADALLLLVANPLDLHLLGVLEDLNDQCSVPGLLLREVGLAHSTCVLLFGQGHVRVLEEL